MFLGETAPLGDERDLYHRMIRRKKLIIVLLAVSAVVIAFMSFAVGTYHMGFRECMDLIFGRIFEGPTDSIYERVIWESRIPRGLAAVFVGAGLAVAGCVMQSMLRNPLADPYTTGVSSGAGLGAAIAIVLGVSIVPLGDTVSTISNAFLMSLVPAFLILFVSSVRRITSTTMILVGIGVMYMFSACTQLLRLIASPTQIEELYKWQLGTLSDISFGNLAVVAIVVTVCLFALYHFRNGLNLMTLGDESALTLGSDPWKTRVICLVIVSFMTAVCVSFTGTIGFVGLVAPQMMRIIMGSDSRFLIPASAMFGAVFMIACDATSRLVGETGIPVGVITAFIGSPLFLYMLVKQSRRNKLRA